MNDKNTRHRNALDGWRAMRRRNRRHRGRRRRRLPPLSVIPTLCTLGNLVAGFAAIHYASRNPSQHVLWDWTPLTMAGAMVFLGMFLDAIDGALARLTRSDSELGAQLDSLADVVTFGIAPAFMTLRLVSIHLANPEIVIGPEADNILGKIIWIAAAIYVSCAALRLARFNVEMGGPTSVNDHSLFRGLPSPGAAGTVTSLVVLHQHLFITILHEDVSQWFLRGSTMGIPAIMLICAFAMVSNVPYLHFANRYFRGRRDFGYIVRVVLILFLTVLRFQEMLAIGFTVYAISGPIRLVHHRLRGKHAGHGATLPGDVSVQRPAEHEHI
jgi:CDP-diacylglycerol--serine O-phosphatidyltransferase